jgi:hypothetical protein
MELIKELEMEAALAQPLMVGPAPLGTRLVLPVLEGTVEGDRIRGRFVGAGADWVLIGPDGWGRVDVRAQVETVDGAIIYVAYVGLLELNEKAMAAAMTPGLETGYEDQYFRTTPRLETGDDRYAWVNHTLFVAAGRFSTNGVAYEVYRVA